MSWAIERDSTGRPARMIWMGWQKPREPEARKIVPGCPGCGFHFGWHAMGCKRRTDQPAGDANG